MHLRNAAHGVGVLYLGAVGSAMRFSNLAALEQSPHIRSNLHLTGMWTYLVNSFVECDIGSAQCVERHRTEHVGGVRQYLGLYKRERSHCQHALRAIDQRDGFLCF